MIDQAQAVEPDVTERMAQFLESEDDAPELPEEDSAPVEEDAADEDAEESPAEPEALEVITHNGEEKQLTKAELKELAQQGFDYTQKTQQLAEERRYVEAEKANLQYQAQFQAQFTDQIAQAKAIEGQLAEYKAVNWSQWVDQIRQLSIEDPMQYQAEHARYQAARLQHDTLKESYQSQLQNLNQIQQQAQQVATKQQAELKARESQAMRQAIPEWKDDARAHAEWTKIQASLIKAGYEPDALNTIMDHRQVVIARKAMLYDEMMATGQKKVSAAPPSVKPGSTAKPTAAANDAKLRQGLKKTGNGEYAAKLIERLL